MKNKERNGPREIYTFFKNKFTRHERESQSFVDYQVFSSVLKDFNRELSRMIIEEAIEFKMPLRLGYVRVKKFKKKFMLRSDGTIDKSNQSVNWKETKELWAQQYPGKDCKELKEIKGKPLVYHLNEHTDGYGFFLYWNKKGSNAINRSVYSLIFTFSNNRHLANILQGDKKIDYYE
jgi:hypothetical protein